MKAQKKNKKQKQTQHTESEKEVSFMANNTQAGSTVWFYPVVIRPKVTKVMQHILSSIIHEAV